MKHKLFTLVMTLSLVFTMASSTFAESNQNQDNPNTGVSEEIAEPEVETPVNVTAKPTKKGTIVVKWGKVEDAKSYKVYRATKIDGKYKVVKNTKSTKYTDKKIHPKKTYFYKVTAITTNGVTTFSSEPSEPAKAKLKIKKKFKVKAYAYTGGGTTASGKKAKVGRIAVDPKVIPLGTWLYVEGYGMCQACDTGGNIKGKTIDVYKKTVKQCKKWGVKKPKIYIIG